MFSSIEDALIDYSKGKIVIVVDDENRENEGDMICASDFATPENINYMAQNARGLICVAIDKAIAEKMGFASLEFQSLQGIIDAIGLDSSQLCTYCWNGKG